MPKNESPKTFMREAYYVPSSKNCGKLFNEITPLEGKEDDE